MKWSPPARAPVRPARAAAAQPAAGTRASIEMSTSSLTLSVPNSAE